MIIHHQGADSLVQHRFELGSPMKFSVGNAEDAVLSPEAADQRSSAELIGWLDDYAHINREKEDGFIYRGRLS